MFSCFCFWVGMFGILTVLLCNFQVPAHVTGTAFLILVYGTVFWFSVCDLFEIIAPTVLNNVCINKTSVDFIVVIYLVLCQGQTLPPITSFNEAENHYAWHLSPIPTSGVCHWFPKMAPHEASVCASFLFRNEKMNKGWMAHLVSTLHKMSNHVSPLWCYQELQKISF